MEDRQYPSGDSLDLSDHLSSEVWDEDETEELDPRVQDELEALNSAAESINRLENEVQRARAKFRLMKAESTQKLQACSKKIGRKWVIKARPYYDLLAQSEKAQLEAQRATIKFQKANSFYKSAKETVTLAEQQVVMEDGATVMFDSAWQEMLNHATMKFMEAEKEKAACELDHEQKAKDYAVIQQKLNFMLKDMPRTINRAKTFYELKETLQSRLQAERQNAEDLHLALICSKQKYKMALNCLENISEEVHRNRRLRLHVPLWRTPGVGAESDACSEMSDMPSINLDFMSETASQVSFDDFAEDGSWSPQLDVDLTWEEDLQEQPDTISAGEMPGKMPDAGSQKSIGQIFVRLGNNLSRMTQEIGKMSSTSDRPEEMPFPSVTNSLDMVRDDTVDGAEDQCTSEQSIKGTRDSKIVQRKMIRSLSCEHLVQQMSVVNLGLQDPTELPSRVFGKPPIPSSPRRVSVSSLKSGVYVTQSLVPHGKVDTTSSAISAKPGITKPNAQFPILYDLKSANQKTSSAWKPVSFLQNLQARGTPKVQTHYQGTPVKVSGSLASKVDEKPMNPSSSTQTGNLNASKKSSNMDLTGPVGEEIFV